LSDERALERRVIRVDPRDVFGPSSGPLEQRAREMARATPYSFEEIRSAIHDVNAQRREARLPEIPREDWIELMQPGAQLASVMGQSLISAYWSITMVIGVDP
jgi:hypothetical protein